MDNLFVPERLENETFEQYRVRRLNAAAKQKNIKHGKMFWDSKELGTYRKPKETVDE